MFTVFKVRQNNKRNSLCNCGSGLKNKKCCKSFDEVKMVDQRKNPPVEPVVESSKETENNNE
jgi:hypothetical protein